MRMSYGLTGAMLAAALLAAGCGQGLKKENDRLRAQVVALQKENLALKGESTSLKADAEAMKKQFDALTKEKQALEEKIKEVEARIAAQPTTRPPQKPKRMSMP
jgi:predicted nuclease with TOPRIM domain